MSLAGASADIRLNWTNHLTFTDGEEFSWRKVLSCFNELAAKVLTSFRVTQHILANIACCIAAISKRDGITFIA